MASNFQNKKVGSLAAAAEMSYGSCLQPRPPVDCRWQLSACLPPRYPSWVNSPFTYILGNWKLCTYLGDLMATQTGQLVASPEWRCNCFRQACSSSPDARLDHPVTGFNKKYMKCSIRFTTVETMNFSFLFIYYKSYISLLYSF